MSMVRIQPEVHARLTEIRDRDGIPIAKQVHRALLAWCEGQASPVRKPGPGRPPKDRAAEIERAAQTVPTTPEEEDPVREVGPAPQNISRATGRACTKCGHPEGTPDTGRKCNHFYFRHN